MRQRATIYFCSTVLPLRKRVLIVRRPGPGRPAILRESYDRDRCDAELTSYINSVFIQHRLLNEPGGSS